MTDSVVVKILVAFKAYVNYYVLLFDSYDVGIHAYLRAFHLLVLNRYDIS